MLPSLAEYVDQFLLSPGSVEVPDAWQTRRAAGWTLATHPTLPVVEVRSADDSHVGWLLGYPIDGDALLRDTLRLPCTISGESDFEQVERVLYGLGGRFACVLLTAGESRLYLDAGGTLAAVYSPERKKAASTATVLLAEEPDHPLFAKPLNDFPNLRPDQFYPAGTTAAEDVARLLPNHYLDLNRWQAVRHHPKQFVRPDDARADDAHVGELVDTIVKTTQAHLRAIARDSRNFYLGLTAGRDTRMLLACARPVVDQARFVTFDYRPVSGQGKHRLDIWASLKLADQFQLQHKLLAVEPISEAVRQDYSLRIGHAGGHGKSKDFYFTCREYLDLNLPWLTGFAAEVGRAFYWRSANEQTAAIDSEEILSRMRLPLWPPFTEAMDRWIEGLPAEADGHLRLDLAYQEHRLGCWASPHLYGAAGFRINLMPFSHRRIFDAMLQLPVEYRFQQRLAEDVVRAAWPELQSLPYNEWSGIRRVARQIAWPLRVVVRTARRRGRKS
ncbi:MAG: hypothetical protein WDZ59_12140 [Pirellulales bacterium]